MGVVENFDPALVDNQSSPSAGTKKKETPPPPRPPFPTVTFPTVRGVVSGAMSTGMDIGRGIARGVSSGISGLEQLAGNVQEAAGQATSNVPSDIPVWARGKNYKPKYESAIAAGPNYLQYAAEERRKQLAGGEKPKSAAGEIAESGTGMAIGAIPYALVPEGPVWAGLVGFMQDIDKGVVEAAKSGLVSGTLSKFLPLAEREVEAVIPASKGVARPAAKATVAGITTGLSGGSPSDVAAAAISGTVGSTKKTKPPFGPTTKPELKTIFPESKAGSWLQEQAERLLNPGKYLPRKGDRVAKLAGSMPGAKVDDIAAVLPELDKTIRDPKYAVAPKGVVKTEGNIARPGAGVKQNETMGALLANTMERLQKRWDDGNGHGVFGQFKSHPVSTDSVANSLMSGITPGMTKLEALQGTPGHPTTDAGKFADRVRQVAEQFRGYTGRDRLTLEEIDNLRQYYYNAQRTGEKARELQRSSADVFADKTIEETLRKLEYDTLETLNRISPGNDPNEVRHIKDMQRRLYGLIDTNNERADEFLSDAAIRQGHGLVERMGITGALHPSTMMPVFSIHGLVQHLTGGAPQDLKRREAAIREAFSTKGGEPYTKTGKIAKVVKQAATGTAKAAAEKGVIAKAAQSGRTVPMVYPDGTTRDTPMDKVDEMKKHGARMVE